MRSIHTPFDESHLLLSLSLRWLFGKINMNVRHILCSATQPLSRCSIATLSTFFFLRIRISNCVIVLVSIHTLEYENYGFASPLRYWNWARACFYSWHFASDKNHFFRVEIQACNWNIKYPFQDIRKWWLSNPIGKSIPRDVNEFWAIFHFKQILNLFQCKNW